VGIAAGRVGQSEQATSEYGMLRMWLVEHFQSVERRLAASDTSTLFTRLSEQWINASTIPIGMGLRSEAWAIIRLEPDFSVRNAHIQGAGGQKLAEQLLKNSPDGIDFLGLAVRRRIVHYAANGWPQDILQLDEKGRRDDMGNYVSGNPGAVQAWIRTHGLPRIKKVTGD
jgi:hypothetical protein